MEELDIIRIDDDGRHARRDPVSSEVPFTINVNGRELATLLASPGGLRELAVGFVFSAGLIREAADLAEVTVDERRWRAEVTLTNAEAPVELAGRRLYTSGCGRGTLFYRALDLSARRPNPSALRLGAGEVLALMHEFVSSSEEFRRTGGVHSAALAEPGTILACREDIGRHNAVDKIIGRMVLEPVAGEGRLILVSGRLSSEIVLKAARVGVPVLVSRSAPTNQGVRLAREANLTLVGFARGRRMNVYSAPERIE
jgi:FdhD protein